MDPEEAEALLRLGLHQLPADAFPHLRGLASELVHCDGAAELNEGLNCVPIGLQAQLEGHTRLSATEHGHRRRLANVGEEDVLGG